MWYWNANIEGRTLCIFLFECSELVIDIARNEQHKKKTCFITPIWTWLLLLNFKYGRGVFALRDFRTIKHLTDRLLIFIQRCRVRIFVVTAIVPRSFVAFTISSLKCQFRPWFRPQLFPATCLPFYHPVWSVTGRCLSLTECNSPDWVSASGSPKYKARELIAIPLLRSCRSCWNASRIVLYVQTAMRGWMLKCVPAIVVPAVQFSTEQYSTVQKGRVQNSTGLPIEPGGWRQDAQKTNANGDLFYLASRLLFSVRPPGVTGVTVRRFNYQRFPDVVYLEITFSSRLISVYKLGRKFCFLRGRHFVYQLNSVN